MQDVTKDRDKYIGGSDIPAIMGVSRFRTRFELLQEKAGIIERDFEGNEYTEYGNVMEPVIRDFLNEKLKMFFKEDKRIDGHYRYHADGYDDEGVLLEIKTTSQIHNCVKKYDEYLAQLLFGMQMFNAEKGVLAVYSRPEDFNTNFDEKRLQFYQISKADFSEKLSAISQELEAFEIDLTFLTEHPFTDEAGLPSRSTIVPLVNEVARFEAEMQAYKNLEKQYKVVREQLEEAMREHNIKSWDLPTMKISLVKDGEDKEVEVFDTENFAKNEQKLYQKYLKKEVKKGRKGGIRITPKKAK